MATKDKTSATKRSADQATVTRIRATDTQGRNKSTSKETTKAAPIEKMAADSGTGRLAVPFIATSNYFRGAWYELRQVRWPNRKATWSLTAAVLGFTAFFVVIILLLDAFFKYIFQVILG